MCKEREREREGEREEMYLYLSLSRKSFPYIKYCGIHLIIGRNLIRVPKIIFSLFQNVAKLFDQANGLKEKKKIGANRKSGLQKKVK